MKLSKEESINYINSHKIFSLNKEDNQDLYDYECNKFIAFVYDFCDNYNFFINIDLTQYGLEFIEVITNCIKSYSSERGTFLSLFKYSFYNRIKKEYAIEKIDSIRKGISISDADNRLIRKIITFARIKGEDIYSEKYLKLVSSQLNLDVEFVRNLLSINYNAVCTSNIIMENGEEMDIFEDTNAISKINKNNIDDLEIKSDIYEVLVDINHVFNSLQNREITNSIISKILTSIILKEILPDFSIDIILKFEFIDKELINDYYKTQKIPTNKEIGCMFNVSEQSVSRTFKTFKDKLLKYRNEKD